MPGSRRVADAKPSAALVTDAAPTRGPPAWDEAPEPASDWELVTQPEPAFEFDQRITWWSPSPSGSGAETPRFAAVRHDPRPPQRAASAGNGRRASGLPKQKSTRQCAVVKLRELERAKDARLRKLEPA